MRLGRDLTMRHSLLFEKRAKKLFSFANDIYRYGKFSELVSFMVWEFLHKLGLFPKENYLKFNNNEVLLLKNGQLNATHFIENMEDFFKKQKLNIVSSEHNWKRLFINTKKEIFGSLYEDDRGLYKSTNNGNSKVLIARFPQKIKSIFISSQNTIFVCTKGVIYKDTFNGNFKKSLDLGSPESFFRHNNEMTEMPDRTLIIGEYGNIWDKNGWRKLAYLYFSSDEGETWERSDFLIKKGVNKHVHLVKYSKLFNKVFMADGDNYKKLWVNNASNSSDLKDPKKWQPINKFHIQMGGYTSVVESDDKLLFGTDYQGGTNFLVETSDGEKFTKKIIPDPYRRSPIINMVQRKSKNGIEIWAVLPFSTANSKCLLMYSMNGGQNWIRVIEYDKAKHHIGLLNSSNELSDDLYFSIEDLKNNNRVVYRVTN